MKCLAVVPVFVALSLTAPALLHAQSGAMKGMEADKKSESKTHKGIGTVKKIDAAAGRVTLAHEPIPSLKWPAMTMGFAVKDKALLGRFAQDKKVEFEFVQQGRDYVVTSVK
jgi:Cu(I)/Ag(I) efflux system protein CusF